ncbi:MAG: hypothetical protein RMY29_032245 [Nostoc sp. CreGUA01]|nr:hypothetical protein [Nostoc sp. CreGUA01]
MTSNNIEIESIESVEATFVESTESTVIIEISSQTEELVEIEMAGESDEVKRETKALIEALKRRAQAEADSAGTVTRETYLNAVRRARELIEERKVMEGDRVNIENAWAVILDEAQRNWYLMMKDVVDFNFRVQKAAKAAWEAFNHPYSQN